VSDDLRARIRAQFGDGIPERSYRTDQSTAEHPSYPAPPAPVDLPQIVWPVKLLLPWSYLVSDNARYVARIAGSMDHPHAKLNLTPDYRRGKGQVAELARKRLQGAEPASIALRLEARVWVPDEIRAHDVCNFAKAVHDALQGIVYVNDRWLWDTRWIRAGVDVDAPRCELTIAPLIATAVSEIAGRDRDAHDSNAPPQPPRAA
jgi:Holliday junction resolvase RusA-like endonuclease